MILTDAQRQMYLNFVWTFPNCWACEYQPLPPLENVAFNPVENHHLVTGSGRKHDRRCLVRLCKVHHDLHHGYTYRFRGQSLPPMTLSNLLWLKKRFDPDYLDFAYIQSLRIKHAEILTLDPVIYLIFSPEGFADDHGQ